jgi:hypothetical protein
MAELAMQRDEEARASGWEDYLAFEEEERRMNEQQHMNGDAQDKSSTQH